MELNYQLELLLVNFMLDEIEIPDEHLPDPFDEVLGG